MYSSPYRIKNIRDETISSSLIYKSLAWRGILYVVLSLLKHDTDHIHHRHPFILLQPIHLKYYTCITVVQGGYPHTKLFPQHNKSGDTMLHKSIKKSSGTSVRERKKKAQRRSSVKVHSRQKRQAVCPLS